MKKIKIKFIVAIIVILAIVGICIVVYNKSNNNSSTEDIAEAEASGEIVKIENFKYDIKGEGQEINRYKEGGLITNETIYAIDMIQEKGYIIYKNGLVIKYDNIKGTKDIVKTLTQKQISEIIQLADEIDKTKVNTIMTLLPVSSGRIIIVHNSKGEAITIKDAYNDNYSEASEEIKKILHNYGLI